MADGAHGAQGEPLPLGLRAKDLLRDLVLRGETSTVLDRAQAEKVAALIPGGKGRFGEVPGVGHGLHGEDLEGTAGVIREFLEA